MKICFFGADFPPTGGGIATYVYDWMRESSKHRDVSRVKALMFGNKIPRQEKISDALSVKTVKGNGFLYTGFVTFIFMLRNLKFDLFHSLNLFPVGFWIVFWSKILGKKSAVTFYGTDACSALASTKTAFFKKWTLLKATYSITISEATKEHVKKRLKMEREIKVIYPVLPEHYSARDIAVDQIEIQKDEIRKKYGIDKETFVVLNISRLVKRKGLNYLIESASILKDENIKFIFVGGGKEEVEIRKEVDRLNVSDKVFITGHVKNLEPYYSLANVVTLVSYLIEEEYDFEGLGLVLIEAQNLGIPVIGSQNGGIKEAFIDGKTGFLVPERNARAIAEKILVFKNDNNLGRKMGEDGKIFVADRFNSNKNIETYIKYVSNK
jgi:glycosyltransferase involved in cell wall biosynthesis